jgi:protein gp37
MAETSSIEWTDATWNPVTGCSVVSPGCTNCYAMKLAGTRLQHHPSRASLTHKTKSGPVWTGEVRLNEQWLTQPLKWRRPRRIFVCAHGDLFHESVPDEWIDRVFAVMALAPQHSFQVLTKRAERMRGYFANNHVMARIYSAVQDQLLADQSWRSDPKRTTAALGATIALGKRWPLPNVWLGVSVEDQARADERIPQLLATPAEVRFLSCEPLLGPVDLRWALGHRLDIAAGFLERGHFSPGLETLRRLDWVIAGGESGPGARPMHPDWARSLRDQCAAAGVPFFFKQWGEWGPASCQCDGLGARDSREMKQLGKKAAGRLLDGVEHNGMPGAAHV